MIGPNGSGKTTLLEVLLGLLPVASGTVRILGQLPGETDAIAYVPQDYTAAAGSALRARDMVALGLTGTSWGFRRTTAAQWKRIEDTMRAVDAFEVIDQRLATLSGGQRQRVAIAQALVSEPKLLLLDEPLANLDLRNQREVISLLDRLNSTLGVTIIMVAHDLNPCFTCSTERCTSWTATRTTTRSTASSTMRCSRTCTAPLCTSSAPFKATCSSEESEHHHGIDLRVP